tara:strand:+ start:101 stop:1057 length:957 start_codon:yes stop_codon:yes gene_type:complete
MSCGRLALDRLGIPVTNYYAAEIDKYAIQVSEANYPDIIRLGDVCGVKAKDLPKIDLVMGGSPCQGFSFAGAQLAFDDPRSALFFEFVRILKECKPKYFLLENVKMKKEFLDIISQQVGAEPILINSALVSAQNRQRYYWTNIPEVEQPENRGVVLRDILETESVSDEFRYSQKSIDYMNRGNEKWQQAGNRRADRYEQTADKDKSFAITANWHKGVPYNYFKDGKRMDRDSLVVEKSKIREKSKTVRSGGRGSYDRHEWDSVDEMHWRKLTPIECERLQTVPDNYTNHVSNTQRYKMLGNGWTIEVIAHILKGVLND